MDYVSVCVVFFFQAEDGIRDKLVTGVQTCALPISRCGKEEQHGRGIEQQRHDEDEPPQHRLVDLAEQSGKISDGPKIGLDGATHALHSGFLDFRSARAFASTASLSASLRLACRLSS